MNLLTPQTQLWIVIAIVAIAVLTVIKRVFSVNRNCCDSQCDKCRKRRRCENKREKS